MTQAELAAKAGLERSRFTRWRQGEKPNLDNARRVAKALGVTPMEVMVGFHLITAEEADQRVASPDPAVLTDQQLVAELNRRLKRTTPGSKSSDDSSPGDT